MGQICESGLIGPPSDHPLPLASVASFLHRLALVVAMQAPISSSELPPPDRLQAEIAVQTVVVMRLSLTICSANSSSLRSTRPLGPRGADSPLLRFRPAPLQAALARQDSQRPFLF